jgi:hypothetical protein
LRTIWPSWIGIWSIAQIIRIQSEKIRFSRILIQYICIYLIRIQAYRRIRILIQITVPNGIPIFSDPKQKFCSPEGLTGTVSDILWPMVEKSVSRAWGIRPGSSGVPCEYRKV